MKEVHYDVAVIGGGASGLMAAGVAAERGLSVVILEKNNAVGKKLDISGGGRCNITNAEYDDHVLLKHYGAAEQFLYSPFSQFSVKDTFAFFEKHGLPLVVEARARAFPKTQKASDVTRILKQYARAGKATILTGTPVQRLEHAGGRVTVAVCKGLKVTAGSFIIAVGGVSHPETGSSGDGFTWLKALGHTVHAPSPSIVPLKAGEDWVKTVSGTSLSFMKISFYAEGATKKTFSKEGKILFTHFGISGPLILNSAQQVGEMLEAGNVTARIDMYPDTNFADLERRTLKVLDANKNKNVKNLMDQIAPHGMGATIFDMLALADPNVKAHSFAKEDRKRLVHLLKELPLTITGLMGFDRAVVADGGVDLTEVDTRTMRSRLFSNLYLTGDILHINRPSGGYSLQLCWTTGYVAGSSASAR